MLVLITLNANGTMRFSDIHKTIEDVSQRMLTVTLRTLESDGLVERKVYAEVPPRVEYCLTDTGGTLIPHIEGLLAMLWIGASTRSALGVHGMAGTSRPDSTRRGPSARSSRMARMW